MSILLYGCTTWMLTKRMEKKLDGNYTRMLRAILNKSWRQHPTKQQLYGHLPLITKTIQVRLAIHAEHFWRSRDGLISVILPWTPSHGRAKARQPARTYIQQHMADTGRSGLAAWHDDDVLLDGAFNITPSLLSEYLSLRQLIFKTLDSSWRKCTRWPCVI